MCTNAQPRFLLTLLMIWIGSVDVAGAADPSPVDLSRINIGELSQVQSETMLFTAQAARARAQEEIVNGGKSPPVTTAQANQSTYSALPPATNAQPLLPVVKTVFRSNNALYATLLYGSGFEVDASMGSADLPGGYKVLSVSLDRVVLEHNGRRFPLGFSIRPPSAVPEASQMSLQSLTPLAPSQPSPMSPLSSTSQELQR